MVCFCFAALFSHSRWLLSMLNYYYYIVCGSIPYTNSVHHSRLPNRLPSARLTIGDQWCLCALLRISWNLVQMILNNFVLAFPLYHFTVVRWNVFCARDVFVVLQRLYCITAFFFAGSSIGSSRAHFKHTSTHTLALIFFHVDFLRADSIVSSALCHLPEMCIITRPSACLPGRPPIVPTKIQRTYRYKYISSGGGSSDIDVGMPPSHSVHTIFVKDNHLFGFSLSLVLTLRGWPLGVFAASVQTANVLREVLIYEYYLWTIKAILRGLGYDFFFSSGMRATEMIDGIIYLFAVAMAAAPSSRHQWFMNEYLFIYLLLLLRSRSTRARVCVCVRDSRDTSCTDVRFVQAIKDFNT